MARTRLAVVATGLVSAGCAIPNAMVQDIPSLPSAQPQEVAAAFEFEPHDEYANVYIRKPIANIYLDVEVGGEKLGSIRNGQVTNFRLAPGRYPFRTTTTFIGNDISLNALFDLEVAGGAVVLLDCYSEMSSGIMMKVPDDPILQPLSACSGDELTRAGGVTACIKPYPETRILKIEGLGRTHPNSACYLTDDRAGFADVKLVRAKHSFITNEAYEYSRAERTGTRAGYEKFLRDYPKTARRGDAQAAIRRIEQQQAAAKFENSVASMLTRDAQLPLETRKDKYMLALTGKLQKKDYRGALVYFEALDRLWIELGPTFTFLWGDTLLKAGDRTAGLRRLHDYLGQAGSSGDYYASALKLINKAEGS